MANEAGTWSVISCQFQEASLDYFIASMHSPNGRQIVERTVSDIESGGNSHHSHEPRNHYNWSNPKVDLGQPIAKGTMSSSHTPTDCYPATGRGLCNSLNHHLHGVARPGLFQWRFFYSQNPNIMKVIRLSQHQWVNPNKFEWRDLSSPVRSLFTHCKTIC